MIGTRTNGTPDRRIASGRPQRICTLCTAALGLVMLFAVITAAPQASDEFERIREKAAEMCTAVNNAEYAAFGDGADSQLDKAYGGYGYLINPSKLTRLAEMVGEAPDPQSAAQRQRTVQIITFHALQAQVAPVIDNYRNSFRENSIRVEGDPVVLQGMSFRIGMQEDQDTRRKWWLAAGQLYKGLNVYLRSLLLDLDSAAQELGHESYHAFLQESEGWDLGVMEAAATDFLQTSEEEYSGLLEDWAEREMEMRLRKLRAYDVDRLRFFPRLSSQVKCEKPEDVAAATLKKLGIDLGGQRTMRVDVRERQGRCPGASAYPISTGKTYVTMVPSGYISDIQELLGALGEAEFYHNMPGDLRFEDAYFGSNVLPAVYRGLFELIVEEPGWIARHIKLQGASADDLAAAFRLRRLMRVRSAAGNLLFQLKLHQNPAIAPQEFADQMEAALLWRHTENDADAYLASNDDYRSGGAVLGARIALQIRDALREEWGEEWYRNEELGRRLEQGARQGYALALKDFLSIWRLSELDASLIPTPSDQG
jgi:hypothetical protein